MAKRTCIACKKQKGTKCFYKKPLLVSGRDKKCKACRLEVSRIHERSPKNRLVRLKYKIKSKYNLEYEDFISMFEKQNKSCKICKVKLVRVKTNIDESLCVDHCHKTNLVRGILCNLCNRGLGQFKDDILHMEKAIQYLKNFENMRKLRKKR